MVRERVKEERSKELAGVIGDWNTSLKSSPVVATDLVHNIARQVKFGGRGGESKKCRA